MTVVKWDLPLDPPPFWLRPELEVTRANDAPKPPKAEFIIRVIKALFALGLTLDQVLGVAANTMNETEWGKYYRGWNLGGWKMFKGDAVNPDGSPRRWYRAAGNKSSGDPPTCFYRAFDSLEQFYEEWLRRFVPKNAGAKHRYKKTGEAFWKGEEWLDDLIAAGYKGEGTKNKPERSIAEHGWIIRELCEYWAQWCLGVTVDGKWGPKSKEACEKFQKANGLKVTGTLDKATMLAISNTKDAKFVSDEVLGAKKEETKKAEVQTPPTPPPPSSPTPKAP